MKTDVTQQSSNNSPKTLSRFLKEKNCDPKTLNVIVGRGGLLKPIPGGTYAVSEALLADLKAGVQGQHASNLGALIAYEIAKNENIPAYIYDGVTVDEKLPILRVTGLPEMRRKGMGHNLNMRAAAMRYAKEHNKAYKDCSLIVVHLGGGISVSLHHDGKVADIINDEDIVIGVQILEMHRLAVSSAGLASDLRG